MRYTAPRKSCRELAFPSTKIAFKSSTTTNDPNRTLTLNTVLVRLHTKPPLVQYSIWKAHLHVLGIRARPPTKKWGITRSSSTPHKTHLNQRQTEKSENVPPFTRQQFNNELAKKANACLRVVAPHEAASTPRTHAGLFSTKTRTCVRYAYSCGR